MTPLMLAAYYKAVDPDVTRALLEHGANAKARSSKGWTALHFVCRRLDAKYRFDADVIAALKDAGVDPTLTGDDGHTANFHLWFSWDPFEEKWDIDDTTSQWIRANVPQELQDWLEA